GWRAAGGRAPATGQAGGRPRRRPPPHNRATRIQAVLVAARQPTATAVRCLPPSGGWASKAARPKTAAPTPVSDSAATGKAGDSIGTLASTCSELRSSVTAATV